MKKDNQIYSTEELEFFKRIENGDYKPLSREEFEKKNRELQKIATNTMKRKAISIRVFESDIDKIKNIAADEGMPYQTFITSLLHKVATKKIVIS